MKARARRLIIFWFGVERRAWISIYPKRVWDVDKDNDKVTLTSGIVSIEVNCEDYERNFVEI